MYGLPFAVLDMNEKENDTENHANASHHHVGNPQEVVFPTQVGRCRQDHLFPPRKLGNLEVCRRQTSQAKSLDGDLPKVRSPCHAPF